MRPLSRPPSRNVALILCAVAAMAVAVWGVGRLQRDTVARSSGQTEAARGILTAMLDQETSLRGYLQTRREEFLGPYRLGVRELTAAQVALRRTTDPEDLRVRRLLDRAESLALQWRMGTDDVIAAARRGRTQRVPISDAIRRKALMDDLRATVAELVEHLRAERARALRRTSNLSVAVIVVLSLLFAIVGWLTIGRPTALRERRDREDARRRDRQADFARTLQFMDSEAETHDLVRRHLEQHVPGSEVVVLQRNNSADRLEATTTLRPGHPLAEELAVTEPRACLAVRLGRRHESGGEALLSCELCGRLEAELTTCTPLLVSGEVIGSVLVAHDQPLGRTDDEYVTETVTQAAPVIANMRNLAIAERRAATDALTGLANRRAIQDALRRMVAQASRSEQTLAAVAMDLDHFKQINDRFGHDAGDEVLAAAAQTLTGTLRVSDFVGRMGGEEFIMLLPDTGLEGALVAAENLRRAIAGLRVPGVSGPVTGSFGVATFPHDAPDAEMLLRQADRALYAAKGAGRDRVVAVASDIAV